MPFFLTTAFLASTLLTSCNSTPAEQSTSDFSVTQTDQGKKGKRGKKGKKSKGENVELNKVGDLEEVRESSGLALADTPGTFYTFSDAGNPPIVYKVSETGKLLGTLRLSATNHDWESISRDNQGYYYMADAGNNSNDREDLAILRFRPKTPSQIDKINFSYADQTEFPPKKGDRNFDVEASLWHQNQIYLFTKDRANSSTSKVYTLPDQPGTHKAKLLTKLSIPGQVTDANLSPNGRRLVLMGREERFVLEGSSLADVLKATPRQISLKGAGQTEGVVFTDDNTIYISTEQGDLYKYEF